MLTINQTQLTARIAAAVAKRLALPDVSKAAAHMKSLEAPRSTVAEDTLAEDAVRLRRAAASTGHMQLAVETSASPG